MKKLNLMLNLEGIKTDQKPQEAMVMVLKNLCLISKKEKGMNEEERRKYYKLCDALDAAVKSGLQEVELEDDWFGFLRACKKEAKITPDIALRRVEELIDEVKDR